MSPERRWFAVIDNLSVSVWDASKLAASNGTVAPIQLAFEEKDGKEYGSLFDLIAFSTSGTWLAAYSSKVETVAAWKFEGGQFERRLLVDLPKTTGLGFSSDEKFLAAIDFEGMAHIWEVAGIMDPKPVTLSTIARHTPGEDLLASPDGQWLVATYRGLGGVGVIDLRKVEAGSTMTRLDGAFGIAAFDPSGRRLLTDSRRQYGRLLVWNTQDFRRNPTPVSMGTMDFTLQSLNFSRDGSWLVSSSNREVMVWPYEQSAPGYVFPFPNTIVRHAIMSGNGRWLIVSHQDAVEAWSLDFRELLTRARKQAGRSLTERERQRYLSR